MLEYMPWSKKTYNKCIEKYCLGSFSSLDIELGGECNYHCVYCDSPERKKKCTIPIDCLENLLSENSFDWIYVCGLGEPTYNGNYDKLITLLQLCKKYNVQCSIFSNLSQLTPELMHYIDDGILHVLFKYDSLDPYMNEALYGTNNVKEQLSNIKQIKKTIHVVNGATNIAASIVPTRLNKNYILPIVEDCLESNIYPLIGELELSGKGQTNYENLYLSKEELLQIKVEVEKLIGESYTIPICPSMIFGIHFSFDSYITVDKFSGMSCHWFWLKEPKIQKLIKFTRDVTLSRIENEILAYRASCMSNIEKFLIECPDIGGAFGGCGGNVYQIFQQYYKFHRRDEC